MTESIPLIAEGAWPYIASTFIESIMRDIPVRRREAVRDQMIEVVKIAAYLGKTGDEDGLRTVIRRV